MFIEVIPFGGSIDDEGLTYFVRDELAEAIQIGCLVEVPFRNALDYAIVTKLFLPSPSRRGAGGEVEDSECWKNLGGEVENIRSIVRIITSTPLLAPYQIYSIFDNATHYFVHTHHILSLFLSKTLVKYLEKQDFKALAKSPSPSRRGARGEVEGVEGEVNSETKNIDNLIQFYHHTKNTPFLQTIQEQINLPSPSRRGAGGEVDTHRTLIVFPDDFSIEAYLKACPVDTENTLIIYDRLTETKKYKAFISVYNGEKNIIIWTRRILYYNLSQYDRIFYAEDALHKTAMRFNHTYNHLEILRRMAPRSHLEITIISSLPSIESMYYLHTGIYKKIS